MKTNKICKGWTRGWPENGCYPSVIYMFNSKARHGVIFHPSFFKTEITNLLDVCKHKRVVEWNNKINLLNGGIHR